MGIKASQFTSGKSNYVKRNDVEGGPQRFTIADIEVGETPDKKPALQLIFAGGKKLTLNKTNARVCAALLGDDTDNWKGKKVVCSWDPTVQFQGQMVGGIKIRPQQEEKPVVDAPVDNNLGF